MGWWRDFDGAETADDLATIADAGLDVVRLFMTWEDFQPAADRVDMVMLHRLVQVADLAQQAGLRIMPTLFTGHMSGVNLLPGWALGGSHRDPRFRVLSSGRVSDAGLRNWYADVDVARAQESLAREASAALSGHEAVWAWDLGNENSNCVQPPDRQSGRDWLRRISEAIRSADPRTLVTIGLHMEDLEEDRMLGPAEAARECDFLTMHGYPIYAAWANGPTDEHVLPFLAQLTSWLAGGADVLFSEFGLPTAAGPERESAPSAIGAPVTLAPEEVAAAYTQRALAALHSAGCLGAMAWCYADYAVPTWSEPPLDVAVHERTFGLWRSDGSPKPAVAAMRGFGGVDRVDPPPDHGWIDIEVNEFYTSPRRNTLRLYGRYRERAAASSS